ncbi:MAG: HlyD family efflux transporter periplasmic adaptor subunit [Bacteroidales bacterium]|nr:HlyD family efflux transporter periplasmic adaptor subunit [Bacteroidales bacterium]
MNGMDRKIEKKHPQLKRAIWISAIAVLLLLIIYSMFFGDKSSKLNIETDKITIATVERDIFQDYIAVIGTVEPIQTIYLDAIEGGRVEEILRDEGSKLHKGDVIIRLSNHNLLLEISNHEAEVARAVNELRQARLLMVQQQLINQSSIIDTRKVLKQQERMFRNNEKLFETNSISREELEKSREEYQASLAKLNLLLENQKQDSMFRAIQVAALESSVSRMEKNLVLIRARLDNLDIKAPVDGELATLNPEVGEVINYGTRIGTINILDSYKLKAEIDEHYIDRVKKGLKGACDFSGKDYTAHIEKIFPEVKNGRFFVDMIFDDSVPSQIRIGQTSRIRLELGESRPAVLLSRGGFYQSTGGQWVYVVLPEQHVAVKRAIRIGRQNPRFYEIIEGLEPGEKVIVSGYDNFGNVDKLILK